MEIALKAAAAAVTGSVIALLLRRQTPELSLLLALAAGILAVGFCIGVLGEIADVLRSLTEKSGVPAVLLLPVIKCVGIALLTQIASQLCRDAQQGAAAVFMELCGTLCALYTALPLVRSVYAVIEGLL